MLLIQPMGLGGGVSRSAPAHAHAHTHLSPSQATSMAASTSTVAAQQRLAVLEQQLQPALLQMHPTAADPDCSMFAGTVVVITGAAKGIGHAATLAFAKRGAQLLLTDLDQQAVQAAAQQCRAAGSPKASAEATHHLLTSRTLPSPRRVCRAEAAIQAAANHVPQLWSRAPRWPVWTMRALPRIVLCRAVCRAGAGGGPGRGHHITPGAGHDSRGREG